jgi:peptide/nickel transport system permease protein
MGDGVFGRYLLRRILLMVPVVLIVTLMVFFMLHLTPGDPARVALGEEATPQAVAALRVQLGLNLPLPIQYLHWLGQVVRGNLGRSLIDGTSVTKDIAQRLPVTFELGVLAFLCSLLVGVPVGIIAARLRGSLADWVATILALTFLSVPGFYLGILFILYFAVQLHLFPSGGYVPITKGLGANLALMVLPAVSLGLRTASVIARMLRGSLLEVLGADFVRTARAKGVSERRALWRHALRNALLPVVTVGGLEVAGLLSGVVLTEDIFGIPGLGRLLVDAIFQRDFTTVQGEVLFIALIVLVVNLLTDLSYSLLDPRIQVA